MKDVFRKKNLFLLLIIIIFSTASFSKRSASLFLTSGSNVNDDTRELPLVHNVYILLTFPCFLVIIFFFAFFFKEKKEENFTFENVSDIKAEAFNHINRGCK